MTEFAADIDAEGFAREADEMAEGSGPYTCMKCCAATWNDSDVCDDCEEEARKENERLDGLSPQGEG